MTVGGTRQLSFSAEPPGWKRRQTASATDTLNRIVWFAGERGVRARDRTVCLALMVASAIPDMANSAGSSYKGEVSLPAELLPPLLPAFYSGPA